MTSPLLLPGVVITWSLSWYANPSFLPFAIGLTILWLIDVLFATPTVPTGKLPPFIELHIRAFLHCFKRSKLISEENDVIPSIGSDAVHILFSLEKLWSFDSLIAKGLNPPSPSTEQTDASLSTSPSTQIIEYLSKSPLQRSEFHDQQISVRTDHALNDKFSVYSEQFLSTLTRHIQLLHTIPLTLCPAYYLLPCATLDASIQTFVHFPLAFWNAEHTMTDMTVFFAVPRGSQFFFSSVIIGLRRGISSQRDPQTGQFHETNDLLVDIQTQIMTDKNRITRGYDVEAQEEESLQADLDRINAELAVKKEEFDKIHNIDASSQTRPDYLQDSDIRRLQDEHASLLVRQRTIEQYKQHNKDLENAKKLPPVMVLVATIVNTYTYSNVLGKDYNLASQTQFPHDWVPKSIATSQPATKSSSQIDVTSFETLTSTFLSSTERSSTPQVSIATSHETSASFASLGDTYFPRYYNGIIPWLFGVPTHLQGQLGLSFAAYASLHVYHAMIQDNLSYGQSSAMSLLDDDASKNSSENDTTTVPSTDDTATPPQQKTSMPYRVIFKLRETLTTPAPINVYIGDESSVSMQIPHRGETHLAFKVKNQKLHQQRARQAFREKAQQRAKKTDDTEALRNPQTELESEAAPDQPVVTEQDEADAVAAASSKESFPSFETQRSIKLTVPDDHGDEVLWADGILFSSPL